MERAGWPVARNGSAGLHGLEFDPRGRVNQRVGRPNMRSNTWQWVFFPCRPPANRSKSSWRAAAARRLAGGADDQ
eukprot:4182727-Alexandrium_andersonii.AAC.1